MRKISVLLVVLAMAIPAVATVTVSVQDLKGLTGAINYATTGEKVRAFGIDVTVDSGAVITAVAGYVKGESVAPSNLGYGIFPANFARYITVNATTGVVASWDVNTYTPVAGPNDVGALKGIGTNGITLEMGALYYPANDTSPNAPPTTGTLCKITVDKACTATITLNAARGGVVLTDPQSHLK